MEFKQLGAIAGWAFTGFASLDPPLDLHSGYVLTTFVKTMAISRYSEADTSTGMVQAANVSVVESAPVKALALEAQEEFKARAGEDQQIDAYELQHILNEMFAKSMLNNYRILPENISLLFKKFQNSPGNVMVHSMLNLKQGRTYVVFGENGPNNRLVPPIEEIPDLPLLMTISCI